MRGQQRGAGGRSGSGRLQRRGHSSRVRTAAASWLLLRTGAGARSGGDIGDSSSQSLWPQQRASERVCVVFRVPCIKRPRAVASFPSSLQMTTCLMASGGRWAACTGGSTTSVRCAGQWLLAVQGSWCAWCGGDACQSACRRHWHDLLAGWPLLLLLLLMAAAAAVAAAAAALCRRRMRRMRRRWMM